MRRIKRFCRTLLILLAAAMVPLGLMGCGKEDERPAGDQPAGTEHPAAEKEVSEAEQPAATEHPAGEHPE